MAFALSGLAIIFLAPYLVAYRRWRSNTDLSDDLSNMDISLDSIRMRTPFKGFDPSSRDDRIEQALNILDLPVELIHMIIDCAPASTAVNLKLSCRTLY